MPTNPHSDHLPSSAGPSRHDDSGRPAPERGFWTSKAGLVTVGFLLVAAFFLFSEHRAHALGILPFVLILACPLLHLFMHGGHGGHGSHGMSGRANPKSTSANNLSEGA